MEHHVSASDSGYVCITPNVKRKTLVYGDNTLMTEFRMEKDSCLPMHSHPQEQTGYLVRGHMMLTIGESEYDVNPGDSWMIPGGVVHGAQVLEDTVALEVFAPVREDYIP